MKKMHFLALGFVALLGFYGCTKDRDVDDYNRDEVSKDIAQLEAVEGRYQGTLVSKENGKALGLVQVDLQSDRSVSNLDQEKALLKGRLVFQSESPIQIVFSNSYYNPDAGTFNSSLNVPTTSGATRQLLLRGKIADGVLEGTLSVFGFDEDGARFRLKMQKGKASAGNNLYQASSTKKTSAPENIQKTYRGQIPSLLGGNGFDQVVLLLSNLELSKEERFADLFSPVKKVRASLTLLDPNATDDDSLGMGPSSISLNNAEWEPSVGVLQATNVSSSAQMSAPRFSLNCRSMDPSMMAAKLHCLYQSSERGIRLEFDLDAETAR